MEMETKDRIKTAKGEQPMKKKHHEFTDQEIETLVAAISRRVKENEIKVLKSLDEYCNRILTLTQEAYPQGGSFPVENGATYSGNWYEAHAVDADGNEYMVRWTNVDWEAEDGGDACDWENPDYIHGL